ncbi:MAG: hypothetical protein RI897_3748 [Verrucomicrobiota bacterium]
MHHGGLLEFEGYGDGGGGFGGVLGEFHAEVDHFGGGFAPAFFDVVDTAGDGAASATEGEGGFFADEAIFVGFEGAVIEGAPAECGAGLDDFVEGFPFAFAHLDCFLGAEVGAHDFEEGGAAAADLGDEALADDPAERIGEADADLFLFLGIEHTEDTVNGLAGVDCME